MSQNSKQQNNEATIISNEELQKKMVQKSTFHDNLGERILTISESKLRLCLKDNLDNMGSRAAWQTPAGIAFTILITCLTTNFNDWMVSHFTWQAMFIIAGILSCAWLIVTLIRTPKLKKVDDIVNELMPNKDEISKKQKIK